MIMLLLSRRQTSEQGTAATQNWSAFQELVGIDAIGVPIILFP